MKPDDMLTRAPSCVTGDAAVQHPESDCPPSALKAAIAKAHACVSCGKTMKCSRDGYPPFDCPTCSQFRDRNAPVKKPPAGYRRVCVSRQGYAVVPGDTDEAALANAARLSESDFDWERVDADMIEASAEVVEACNADGSVPPREG